MNNPICVWRGLGGQAEVWDWGGNVYTARAQNGTARYKNEKPIFFKTEREARHVAEYMARNKTNTVSAHDLVRIRKGLEVVVTLLFESESGKYSRQINVKMSNALDGWKLMETAICEIEIGLPPDQLTSDDVFDDCGNLLEVAFYSGASVIHIDYAILGDYLVSASIGRRKNHD